MGRFLNPGNSAFQIALNSRIYVDKTELLDITNQSINTDAAFICNSRPRRFGKSMTANMLSAYYSKGCDSKDMFAGWKISGMDSFEKHLNQYDVIHFDVQWCMMDAGAPEKTVRYLNQHIIDELKTVYPEMISDSVQTAYGAMSQINEATGNRFIVVIDEWDVLIRDEAGNQAVQDEYIDFLRGMFKGTEPTKFISLAYLTGILPIKKLKTQSALNNFKQYTMLSPGPFAPYIGFTEEEVQDLCVQYHQQFDEVKRWYDGYLMGAYHVYNPNAVVNLMVDGTFQSYWSQTGTYEAILPLININFDGLKSAIVTMLSGDEIKVKTTSFQNDMVSFKNMNDVLTLLIHMGYLAYNQKKKTAYIPNEEIREEFLDAVEGNKWSELIEFEQQSDALLEATLNLVEDRMISFASDYIAGAHPIVLQRLVDTNLECLNGYGSDKYCLRAAEKIKKACECPEAEVFFLVGGTQTNQIIISTMLDSHEGVIAATSGHVSSHEAGAIEFLGHKVIQVLEKNGKLDASSIKGVLENFYKDENHEHMVFPGMVYLSFPTEYGTIYSKPELTQIYEVCKEYQIPLFMDGARLGYGLCCEECDITLADLPKLCDVFYIGGTKVGALCGEAVVFTHKNAPKHFVTKIKQRGALLAKGRVLGVQFDALFTDDLYMKISKHAIEMANRLKALFMEKGYRFYIDSPTNQQFIILENEKMKALQKEVSFSFWENYDEHHTVVRFATSWSTTEEDIDELRRILDGAGGIVEE